jgi:PhnB protein
MTVTLNPYLTFGGNCREAMEFYKSVLGGELTINTFGDFGGDPAIADNVMHAMLVGGLGSLMASDSGPGMGTPTHGSTITISLSGAEGDGLEDAWAKLADGGQVTMPFEKQMWGDHFGQLVDRFGFSWMVNVTPPA